MASRVNNRRHIPLSSNPVARVSKIESPNTAVIAFSIKGKHMTEAQVMHGGPGSDGRISMGMIMHTYYIVVISNRLTCHATVCNILFRYSIFQ